MKKLKLLQNNKVKKLNNVYKGLFILYNREELVDLSKKTDLKYIYFWGGDSYCSNFYPATFKIDDISFTCAEQYMMYKKAEFFGDRKSMLLILQETEPMKIKRLGRGVKGYVDSEWSKVRVDIVYKGVLAKFQQNRHLVLRSDCIYVEASPYDKIWGVGLHAAASEIKNPKNWKGENYLGFILTEVARVLNS